MLTVIVTEKIANKYCRVIFRFIPEVCPFVDTSSVSVFALQLLPKLWYIYFRRRYKHDCMVMLFLCLFAFKATLSFQMKGTGNEY